MSTFPFDIVAVDLDGTLATSDEPISPVTQHAIRQLEARGVQLVIASARMPAGIVRVVGRLHPVTPCIALNGAVIYHTPGGTILPMIATTLSVRYARRIASTAEEMGVTVCIYFPDSRWCASTWNGSVAWEVDACGIQPEQVGPVADMLDEPPAKLLLYTSTPQQATRVATLLREQYASVAECVISDPVCIEVTAKGVSKGNALRHVLAERPLQHPRLLAIGDGLNDLDMFDIADTSVAMGNAQDIVKQHADMVTTTCNEDGIAQALHQLGLEF